MTTAKPAFQLKGSMCTVTVLHLLDTDTERFRHQLKEIVAKSPDFFKNAPVMIDLHALSLTSDLIDFNTICDELRHYGLIPVGFRNASTQHQIQALKAGLAQLPEQKIQTTKKEPNTKIITHPIRGGQKIIHEEGDLIILSQVSAGAEIMASGHIHIYSILRGRALAGIHGDETARIFCHQFQAELISIAGYYLLSDQINIPKHPNGLHISLQDKELKILAF